MPITKYSRQREMILNYLNDTKTHPSADQVFQYVKSEIPNISLGTIYRNLNLLTELGTIQRITTNDGIEHYDATTEPHYHLYCKGCGCIIDMDMPNMPEIEKLAERYFDGVIDGHTTLFFGYCKECYEVCQFKNNNNS